MGLVSGFSDFFHKYPPSMSELNVGGEEEEGGGFSCLAVSRERESLAGLLCDWRTSSRVVQSITRAQGMR